MSERLAVIGEGIKGNEMRFYCYGVIISVELMDIEFYILELTLLILTAHHCYGFIRYVISKDR